MIPSEPASELSLTAEGRTDLLPVETLACFLAGEDAWHIPACAELEIPAMLVADCGHGVTLCGDRTSPSTCLPTGIGMASTWNVELMEQAGAVLGRECLALGVSILLGPKINLHRVPLNGRSFETFSEDPVLAGTLGGAVIRGIQSQGVGACVKAMVCNNQQHEQHSTNVVVDERTLRELYLRTFEIALETGDPCAIMTSYNPLHGVNTSQNRWLIRDLIKGEWGFRGLVVCDWRAADSEKVYDSGLDLEMPGPGKWLGPEGVLTALAEGHLDEADLRDRAGRVLSVGQRFARDESRRDVYAAELDSEKNRQVALQTALESIILLKNEGDLLPLDPERQKKIAVIGPNAAEARLGGGGSASVTPFYSVSPLEGIREAAGEAVDVYYEEGCSLTGAMETVTGCWSGPIQAEFFNGGEFSDSPDTSWEVDRIDFSWGWAAPGPGVTRFSYAVRFRGSLIAQHSGKHRFGVFGQEGAIRFRVNGELMVDDWAPLHDENDFEGAYATRYQTVELDLEAGETVEIELEYGKRAARAAVRLEWEQPGIASPMDRAVQLASDADVAILCLGLCNLFEGGARDREDMDLPGAQRELIDRVTAVNSRVVVVLNNGGPLLMPWEPQVGAIFEAWYAGQEGGRALGRLLFGQACPSGKLPDTIPYQMEDHLSMANYPGDGKEVRYEEGLSVGYRHFDTADLDVHYPFGFGLSYTTFSISEPDWQPGTLAAGGEGTLSVRVTNTGVRAGAEVIQCYVRDVEASVPRPDKELKYFRKVFLEPGEEITVKFSIWHRDLAFWCEQQHAWRVEAGAFEFLVGPDSRNLQTVGWRYPDE